MPNAINNAKSDHKPPKSDSQTIEIDSDSDEDLMLDEQTDFNDDSTSDEEVVNVVHDDDAEDDYIGGVDEVEEEAEEEAEEEESEDDGEETGEDSDNEELSLDCASSSSSLLGDSEIDSDVEYETQILVRNLIKNRKSSGSNPKEIVVNEPVADISCHCSMDLVAIADVEGDIIFAKFGVEKTDIIGEVEVHNRACRAIEFDESGGTLFSVSQDKSIALIDTVTMQTKQYYDDSHGHPLTTVTVMDEHCFVTGDEVGIAKVWDIRKKTSVFTTRHIEDYITSIVYWSCSYFLACTSCDGTLTGYDWRQKKFIMQSEPFSSDLTCAAHFRNESRIVCGTGTGSLLMFTWTNFGAPQESYTPCPSKEINCIVGATENIAVTGWEDGFIRALHLYPHRRIGIVGQHSRTVESLDISHDGKYIASAGFEDVVKFWDISYLGKIDKFERGIDNPSTAYQLPSSDISDRKNFFSDLV